MSPRETAIKLIQELSDDKLFYVLRIIKGVGEMPGNDAGSTSAVKLNALDHLQRLRGRIPVGLDYDKELSQARAERYAGTY